jgi:transcription elongation factor/antiterminator RfaH
MWGDSRPAMSALGIAQPRWYVVYCRLHSEKRAALNLARQGFRAFLPLCTKTIRHARQFRTVEAPFFDRYLFVELQLDRDRWRSVNGTFGVSHLVMEGEKPKPVRPGIVEEMQSAADGRGAIAAAAKLSPGQPVRFASGPFAGMIAELVTMNDDQRVAVLLDMLGTQTSVAFAAAEVSLLPA